MDTIVGIFSPERGVSAIIAAWARGDDSQLENIATSFYHTYNLDKSLWRQNLVYQAPVVAVLRF